MAKLFGGKFDLAPKKCLEFSVFYLKIGKKTKT
jgi:hypothetical protein